MDLVTFTEEIRNRKLHFLYSDSERVFSLPWHFSLTVQYFSQGIQRSFPTSQIHSLREHSVRTSSFPYAGICSERPLKVECDNLHNFSNSSR